MDDLATRRRMEVCPYKNDLTVARFSGGPSESHASTPDLTFAFRPRHLRVPGSDVTRWPSFSRSHSNLFC